MDGGKRVVDYKGVRDAKHLEQFVNKMLKSIPFPSLIVWKVNLS